MIDPAAWAGRRVLVTGHTGFKGSWLSLWLTEMGAAVTGFALAPEEPSLFAQSRVAERIDHVIGDVRDLAAVEEVVEACRPDAIFHLAAQPLVRRSYAEPVETYATNVMGTIHVLEAVRRHAPVPAVICVTTDKCYENREWVWPYRETDPLGGHDPYSSSKGAAEIAIAAWRRSYFDPAKLEQHGTGIASVRAGNVIGGGDYSEDRLIPDILRAVSSGGMPTIRSPGAVRPWQHVLEALGGYLLLAERLLAREARFADAWNFGPDERDARTVGEVAERLLALSGAQGWQREAAAQPHEAQALRLDTSKIRAALGWAPVLDLDISLTMTAAWHRAVSEGSDARKVTLDQISAYAARRLAAAA